MNGRIHRWGVPALIAIAYLIRNFGLIQDPTLFAEEGAFILPRVVYGEWDIVLSGYMNAFTYLGIWVVSKFTITYLPHVLFAISLAVNVLPFFYLLLPHWEKLLPYRYRVAFAVLVLLLNPWHEGMSQFLYCFWYLGLGAGLLLVEQVYLPEDARRWLPGKVAFAVLAGISGPVAFTLGIALLAGLALATLVQGVISRAAFLPGVKACIGLLAKPVVLSILVIGMIQVGLSLAQPQARETQALIGALKVMPAAAFIQLHVMIVVGFLVPYDWMLRIIPLRNVMLALLPLTLLLLALPLLERKAERKDAPSLEPVPLSWMLGLAVPVLFALVYVGRVQMVHYYTSITILSMDGPRYSILQGEIFVLAVLASLSRARFERARMAYVALFTPFVLLHGVADFMNRQATPTEKKWSEVAPLVLEFMAGKHDRVNEPIRPPGWKVLLERSRVKARDL